MKKIHLLLTATVPFLFWTCSNSDDYDTPDLSGLCNDLIVTKTVNEVTTTSTTTLNQWTGDDVIEAYVTSSDEGGNFYKSLSFRSVDGNFGFSMPVDDFNLYTKYEPGRKVFIKLKGRSYVTEHSATVIGSIYNNETPDDTSDDEVGRVSGVEYRNIIVRGCEKVNEDEIVKNLTIAQAKNNQYLNALIEFDAVQFTDASLGKKYFDASLNNLGGATNHTITDANGSTIIVRVSEFATFASQMVPNKNGKIRGVLTKFNNDFQFMVRTINDVKLTNNRVVPLFEETFTSNFPLWTRQSVIGAQVWTLSTTFGNPGSCAVMSGFSGGNQINEDWLISPAINLSGITTAVLTFDNASRFTGNLLEVLVSTNYNSGAPNTATWTPLSGFTLDTNTSSYIWTNSGGLNISSFAGNQNFRVAFKYTSTTSASRTWQVDNVKIVAQ